MIEVKNIAEPVRNHANYSNDEIELIDILRIIWKWKYLIISGTLICTLVTTVVCLFYPKTYRVEMVLQPGTYHIDGRGKSYIDSANKIQFLIESGSFNNGVMVLLEQDKNSNVPSSFNFKVFYSRQAEALTIGYETTDTNQGLKILNSLKTVIEEYYDPVVIAFRDKFDAPITQKQSEILNLQESEKYSNAIFKAIEERIEELIAEIETLNSGLEIYKNDQQKIIPPNKNDNAVSGTFAYNNTRLIDLRYAVTGFKNDLSNYRIQLANEKNLSLERKTAIESLLSNVATLKIDRQMVENVKTLKPPTLNHEPVHPQTLLFITIALAIGLFTTLFLSFLLDYVNNYKRMKS